jgi:ADP-ribose pyrophosphatase YjhB (NUDIX family)
MPMSPYLADLRAQVGSTLLMLPAVTGCLFDREGGLLVARHADFGRWAPPGGAVDPDERPGDAVVRELREELGIGVRVLGLIGVYGGPEFRMVYPNGHVVGYVSSVYGCALTEGLPTPDGEEITAARYVSEQEAERLDTPAWTPLVLPDVFAWWRDRREFIGEQ